MPTQRAPKASGSKAAPQPYPKRQLTWQDLPTDWFACYGEDLVDAYAAEVKRYSVRRCQRIEYSRACWGDPYARYAPRIDEAALSRSLELRTAMRLYNRAAFCYIVQPHLAHPKAASCLSCECLSTFTVHPSQWLGEAFDLWGQHCADAMYDGRHPLEPVKLPLDDSLHSAKWLGLGFDDPQEDLVAQYVDLENLLTRHRHLCDLVQSRADGPRQEMDETILGPWYDRRIECYHSTLIPTCRAVLLIALRSMKESRHVLLVLTGDNDRLMSEPPTFDAIPTAEISGRRGENIVEVSLATAIGFLRKFEAKEEAANQALQWLNNTRRGYIRNTLQELAWEDVAGIAERELEVTDRTSLVGAAVQNVFETVSGLDPSSVADDAF